MDILFAQEARSAAEMLSKWRQFRIRRGMKHRLGEEQRGGWTAPIACYLFWCGKCRRYAKDYPHGHLHRQYLMCSSCGIYHRFVPWRVEWEMFFETFRILWNHRHGSK